MSVSKGFLTSITELRKTEAWKKMIAEQLKKDLANVKLCEEYEKTFGIKTLEDRFK